MYLGITWPASQEFLGLVEVRFLDDMRRRTSLLQQAPYTGMDNNTDHVGSLSIICK
jgi:hypothetical protein